MKKHVALLLALVLSSCAYRHQPIYNVNDALPIPAQNLSDTQIKEAIIESGGSLGWQFRDAGAGHLTGIMKKKQEAIVDIYYDRQRFRIEYSSSSGMNEKNGEIHSHYNIWIRNLERVIINQLSKAR